MESIIEMFKNLTPILWVAQIFGFIGLILYCLSVQFDKKMYFIISALSFFCYAVEQIISNMQVSAVTQIVGLIRSLFFLFFFIKNKEVPKYLIYLLLGLLFVVSFWLMYDKGELTNPLNYLPIILVVMDTIAVQLKNFYVLKIVLLIHQIAYFFYYGVFGLPVSMICQIILCLSILYSIIKSIIIDLKNKKQQVKISND